MTSKSSTTTSSARRTSKKLEPVHPGEVLLEEFLKPMEISQHRLARGISVPPRRINEIVLHKRSVTADTALWHIRTVLAKPADGIRLGC